MAITAISAQNLTDAWNSRRPEAVAARYAPDGVRVVMAFPGGRVEGREALAEHVREIMTACPDCVLETRSEGVSADGLLTFEWTFRATQTADFGAIPGNGQAVELNGVSVIAMDGGLIREERAYWDGATLMAGGGMLG
jgi:steroid delta-isomerase-like uncharacterized protein